MRTLESKTALVTGGSRGIGAAIVRELAKSGVSVAFTYQNSTGLAEQLTRQLETDLAYPDAQSDTASIWPMRVDSLSAEDVQQAVSDVKQRWGRLDILVNNAGIFEAQPIESFTLEDYDKQMA